MASVLLTCYPGTWYGLVHWTVAKLDITMAPSETTQVTVVSHEKMKNPDEVATM